MKMTLLGTLIAIVAALAPQKLQAQNHKDLPENAKSYISRHFENSTINHYEKETDLLDIEHKVYVSYNGVSFRLEFDKYGNVTEICSIDNKTPLPQSVLPVKITQHAKQKFPNANIIEWEKKRSTQSIELDNGVELIYNRNGDFLRIDD
ncbi:MAG: PepSY-like domain-containing protein [Bacteroides sp.]|nr:PepSY-like domain-containing protein [Bacteroides sp.]MCM1446793.1 PepSY-like domain-containing protein [Bacteroides sp.]MCM1514922.1 PepSY-like domain-containing protein [Paraprevotella sp.]